MQASLSAELPSAGEDAVRVAQFKIDEEVFVTVAVIERVAEALVLMFPTVHMPVLLL